MKGRLLCSESRVTTTAGAPALTLPASPGQPLRDLQPNHTPLSPCRRKSPRMRTSKSVGRQGLSKLVLVNEDFSSRGNRSMTGAGPALRAITSKWGTGMSLIVGIHGIRWRPLGSPPRNSPLTIESANLAVRINPRYRRSPTTASASSITRCSLGATLPGTCRATAALSKKHWRLWRR